MHQLRKECPWNEEQTHRSLVHFLVEETCEVVDAIEQGTDADLCEELGDLLLQIVFHAEIAAQENRFTFDDIAEGITAKLIRRHQYVFSDEQMPENLEHAWESQKRREKERNSSLTGIPLRLSALARAHKVVSRARSHIVEVQLAEEPITAQECGQGLLELVSRAQLSGIDPEQTLREALSELEKKIVSTESL
ncbi:MAG: MazG family protein [Propionibacteriaceae bacterium]